MPLQAYPEAIVSPTEPLACRGQKRSRRGTPTIYPAVLSFDAGMSSNQTAPQHLNFVVLQPASSFRDSESESTLDVVMPDPDLSPTIDGVVDTIETQSFDVEPGFDTLFDQYLGSPTSSESPVDTASELSGTTPAISEP